MSWTLAATRDPATAASRHVVCPCGIARALNRRQLVVAGLLAATAALAVIARTTAGVLHMDAGAVPTLELAIGGILSLVVLLRVAWYPAYRTGWLLIALGIVARIADDVVQRIGGTVAELTTTRAGGAESSVLWLVGTLAFAIGTVQLGRRRFMRESTIRWADAVLVASCVAAIAWEATSRWYPQMEVSPTMPGLLGPVLVLALGAGLAVLLMGGGHQAVQVLLLGVLALAVADTLHVVSGSPMDTNLPGPGLTTLVAFGLIAAAAWLDRGPDVDDPPRAASLILPILCVVVATGLLVGASWDAFQTGTTFLAAATVLVGAGRLGLAIKSEGSASDSLRQALTDDLTGLPNRRHFYVNLREALRAAQRTRVPLALLLIDLDRFKEVNDSLGHLAGDDVLRQLRPRLAKVMRGSGLVARIGGDEFAMVLPLGSTSTEAVNAGRRVIAALEAPFELDGFEVRMGASVGVAVYPVHGTTADELLQRADVAMYLAKAGEDHVEVYDPSRDPNSRQRLELTSQLRDAINGAQLVMHYQPKLSVRTGKVEGVEALVRWEHPSRGLLLPSAFLDLVRQSGLMRPLMLTVLRQSLEQVRTWLNLGLTLRVDINLCASNIADDRLLDDIDRALREARVPSEMLGIEVTEDLLLAEPERAETVLTELRARGISISLDDFGSGYSSLAYLGRLPVDELKIDRYFVERLRTNPQAEAIVRSTVELAHSLGMSFVAEGVEDDDQLRVLRALGCDSAQGYLVSKPLPAAALAEWLRGRGELPTTPPTHHGAPGRRWRYRPDAVAWHPPGERMITRIG